ncbi:MAG: hypothetical protein K2X47_00480, partial [Bdellovibrionales bacterium]|nr:hypothetical protein [Bdellovibrionales bacterium]
MEMLRESYQLKRADLRKHGLNTDSTASTAPSTIRTSLEALGYRFPKPAEVWAFMMCKGGVGKTTSAL